MTEITTFEDEFDENQDIARSRFADMLHDTERNQKYYLGLKAAINRMHERGLQANVLDIGTGTGLLSMMAVQLGADSVVACDGFQRAVECAAKIIAANGMSDKIQLIKKHSTQLVVGKDMEKRANILVTEVFDTELIGEGAIETFNHAHEHLLEEDCIVVPTLGTIYVQIIESPIVNSWNTVKSIANLDGEILLRTPKTLNECPGEATLQDLQLSQLTESNFRALTEPVAVFDFDFSSKIPLEKHRKAVKTVKCVQTGLAHGVFMFWDLKMDVDKEVILSCAPYWAHPDFDSTKSEGLPQQSIPWRDHWIQAIYYLPQTNTLLGEEREIEIISNHDEFSLWFEIGKTEAPVLNKKPSCTCGLHLTTSRSRIMQLNDSLRNKKLISHLENWNLKNATLLVVGNGCPLIGLAASKIEPTPSKVFVIEENRILKDVLEEFLDFNKLWNVNVKENCDKIKLPSVTHVLFEPSCVAVLPWDDLKHLNFIKKHQLELPNDVKIAPCKATIKAIPVNFLDLHKIRSPLGSVEGFDMSKYDEMILGAINMADPEVEIHALWEYPCRASGKATNLLEIDVMDLQSTYKNEGMLKIASKCNGIAIWIDWQLNSSPKSVISTGPRSEIHENEFILWSMSSRQGVFFVSETKEMSEMHFSVNYCLETNKLDFEFK
ncbi:protein arginine N-methyltransferase 7 [Culicoides brevitarsis]|uniref:protein arginine N-methyltransferase 7 n=1 Tax=Culicoides brevitarsis TaxID=469753 RepID=UPI00307C6C53